MRNSKKNNSVSEDFEIFGTMLVKYRGKGVDVVIPDGITRVYCDSFANNYCFDCCDHVKSITVPKSLDNIVGDTFYGCFDLEEIIVDSQNPKYYSQGNCVIEKASKKLVVGCKTSIIPDDVKIIGFGAFYGCKNLTSITIPSSVSSIEFGAFGTCISLTDVTLPHGVKSIADRVFIWCKDLKSVTIPEGVETIEESAFYDCTGITDIAIPSSVVSIGDHAFCNCRSLKTVYYGGGEADWDKIRIGKKNEAILSAGRYCYSETQPVASGNYWHYDTDGVTPVKW